MATEGEVSEVTPSSPDTKASEPVIESPSPAESKNTREEVIDALNDAYEIFINFPDDKLTKKQRAERDHLKTVKEATLDKNKGSRRINFEGADGTMYGEQEGVPVDALLNFLLKRIKSRRPPLTEDEKEKYKKLGGIIHRNAKSHDRSAERKKYNRKHGRIIFEAERIASAAGTKKVDYGRAADILFTRRELILPSAPKEPTPEPVVPTPEPEDDSSITSGGVSGPPLPPEDDSSITSGGVSGPPLPPEDESSTPEPGTVEEAPTPEDVDTDSPPEASPDITEEESSPEPTPTTLEEVKIEFTIGNRTSDVRERATELAEEYLRKEQRRGSLLNPLNWARKTRLRVLEEFYRQKYISKATEQMLAANNSYLSLDVFTNAAVDVKHKYEEEKAAGKAKIEQLKIGEIQGQKVEEITGELKDFVFDEIVAKVVNGEIDSEADIQKALREFVKNHEEDAQVKELFGKDATKYGVAADYFASDLLEKGRLLKSDKEAHDYSMERLKELTIIKLANVEWASDTETQWTWTDRAIAWSQKDKRGFLLNPAVVSALTSIGIYGVMRAAGVTGRTLLAAPVVGGILGATFAGIRRAHDLKIDRAAHQSDRAYGGETPENAKRRKKLDKYEYDIASLDTLLHGGVERSSQGDNRGMNELLGLSLASEDPNSASNADALVRRAAEIGARLDFSAENKVDLISYESRETIEQGRLELIKAIAEAKVKLRNSGFSDAEITDKITASRGEWAAQFIQDKEQQDKSFKRYRIKESLKSAGIGGVTGLAVGLGSAAVAKEAIELTGRSAHVAGLENLPGVGSIFGKTGETQPDIGEALRGTESFDVGDVTITPDAEGKISVKLPDGSSHLVENSQITDDGHIKIIGPLPEELNTLNDELKIAGFDVEESTETVKETIINESTPLVQDNTLGKDIMIPEGTSWVQNSQDSGSWDLVVPEHSENVLISGAHLSPEGEITYDSTLSTLGENAIVQKQELIQEAGERVHQVTGPEGDWSKEATSISKREWYAYDTPTSDHNELRAYNSVFDAGDGLRGVEWDMSKMELGYQSNLNPNPIDVQQVIRDGQAGFAFSLPDDSRSVLWISDMSDGVADGKIRLDPNDFVNKIDPNNPNSNMTVGEFSRIVLNQEKLATLPEGSLASEVYGHEDVFRLGSNGERGFIEAGRIVDGDNGKVLQAFATARGENPLPDTITISTPAEFDTLTSIPSKPVEVTNEITTTEFIPPGEEGNLEIPIIPMPISPRYPLGPLKTPIPPPPPYYSYGYGLEVLSPGQQKEVRAKYSERLRNNPEANLDASIEIPDYFNRQTPDHMAQLSEYMDQPGMTEPMDNNCDAVVCIPVYDLGEGQAIGKTLELYSLQIDKTKNKQAIDSNKFELLLFLNHPEGKRAKKDRELGHVYTEGAEARVSAGTPEPHDAEEVIRQFQKDHPELNIRVMKREYDGENIKPWGTIIKDHYDTALLRASRRTDPSQKDPLILTNDADLVNISPTYIRDIVQYMSQNDLDSSAGGVRLDAIVGKIDMPNQGYENEPGFLAAERLYQFLDAQQRRKPGRSAITQGRSTIIRGSAYAAIGGTYESYGAGADTLIGGAIRDARKETKTIEYLNKAWLYSDPRRELDKWQSNVPLAFAWNSWGDTEMYGEGWQDRFRDLPKNTGRIDIEKLQRDIAAERWRWGLEFNSPELQRALSWLGLKPSDYHIGKIKDYDTDGNSTEVEGIVIDNITTLETRLQNFRSEKRWEKADRKRDRALGLDSDT